MRLKKFQLILLFSVCFLGQNDLLSQQVPGNPEVLFIHPTRPSFRGISVVSDEIVWVSGSKGTVGLSTNGGREWKWFQVKGYENRDFRDIQAMDSSIAVIMAVGEPAILLRTTDGGRNWEKVFSDERSGMFLDALHFRDAQNGIVVGDPIGRIPFLARTDDGGRSWQVDTLKHKSGEKILLDSGEAFFAASGTNVHLMNKGKLKNGWIVTGGTRSRLIHLDGQASFDLPFMPGGASRGANSIAMKNQSKGIIVGGDFSRDSAVANNCLLVNLQEEIVPHESLFNRPASPPSGYRSCVAYLFRKTWITCGTSGLDISMDDGVNWLLISRESFHTLGYAKGGNYVYLAGGGGRVARLRIR
jgi:hypothetical protein